LSENKNDGSDPNIAVKTTNEDGEAD